MYIYICTCTNILGIYPYCTTNTDDNTINYDTKTTPYCTPAATGGGRWTQLWTAIARLVALQQGFIIIIGVIYGLIWYNIKIPILKVELYFNIIPYIYTLLYLYYNPI